MVTGLTTEQTLHFISKRNDGDGGTPLAAYLSEVYEMRVINFFNLAVVLIAAFFTWNAVAASGTNVHILENLSSKNQRNFVSP